MLKNFINSEESIYITADDVNPVYTTVIKEAIANLNKWDERKAKIVMEVMKEARKVVGKKLQELSQDKNSQGGFTKEYHVYDFLRNQVNSSYIEAINRVLADSPSAFPGSHKSHDESRRSGSR